MRIAEYRIGVVYMFELSDFDIFSRIFGAILIGGIIGLEREKRKKPAGFITHMLVCVGAAIISIVQSLAARDSINAVLANPELAQIIKIDVGRMTAQVVSGVGFLGAGAILRNKETVVGITTAATLWIVACLGLAIGMGYFGLAITAAILISFLLISMKKVELLIIEKRKEKRLSISLMDTKNSEETLHDFLKTKHIKISKITNIQEIRHATFTEKEAVYHLFIPKYLHTDKVIAEIEKIDGILSVYLVT